MTDMLWRFGIVLVLVALAVCASFYASPQHARDVERTTIRAPGVSHP